MVPSFIAILSSFDTRIAKLEKSITPLYNSTQVLTRRAKSACLSGFVDVELTTVVDIDSALMKIDEVASNQEGIAAEEALILRGYAD